MDFSEVFSKESLGGIGGPKSHSEPPSVRLQRRRVSRLAAMAAAEEDNPFRLPPDEEIFLLREQERRKRAEEREEQKTLKVPRTLSFLAQVTGQCARLAWSS